MKMITPLLASATLVLAACEQKAPEPAPVEPGPETAGGVMLTIKSDPSQGDGGVSDFYSLTGPAQAKPESLIRSSRDASPLPQTLHVARVLGTRGTTDDPDIGSGVRAPGGGRRRGGGAGRGEVCRRHRG